MNALTKFSIALLPLTAAAIAGYLYATPGDEAFDAARSEPQDAICKQDRERLARLRARPSLDEGLRFVGEIRCMQLWPQLQTLLDGLSDPSRSTASSKLDPAASDTTSGSNAASSPGATSATLDDACKHDEARLAALQAKPSLDEAVRFEDELKCSKLQPQLLALLDSLSQALQSAGAQSRNGTPSNTTSASEAVPQTPPASEATPDACKHDEERLAELQAKPSLDEAVRLENEMECLKLQPQLLALLDKLIQAPQSAGAQSPNGVPSNTTSASEAVPRTSEPPASEATSAASDDACKQDEERMARLRTTPSGEEAARFTEELRCETLRPELLALTAALASLPESASVSEDAGAQMNATNETPPAPQAAADAERRIVQLKREKEALAAELSRLRHDQEAPPSAVETKSTPSPQPASPIERSEAQAASQAAADAKRRIAQLKSEKGALAAEVSRLQQQASSEEQANATPSPPPAAPAERSETPSASAATDAERRIAQLESENEALTAEVGRLQHDREAPSADEAKPPPAPPPPAHAKRAASDPFTALASLPTGMPARVLIRYLPNNADARAQAEMLASVLKRQGIEVADLRESRSAIRPELSFAYTPDETIAQQVGRLVGVAPVRRLQPMDGLMVRPGTVELNLSGDSHLAAIKTTSTRESNHE
jgi:hypothetical protein